MGRGRTKGKKLSGSNQDDTGSGEEEKIPTQKRRGRPQKSLKDEMDEEEVVKIEDEDSEDTTGLPPQRDAKFKAATSNGKKRRKNAQVGEEKAELPKEENGTMTKPSTEDGGSKSNGFRQTSSRRKSKPRRAAEAVVECN